MKATLGDLLLWAVTAREKLSYSSFASLWTHVLAGSEAADTALSAGYSRTSSIRLLDALGHCETARADNGGNIAVATPCLSRLAVFGAPRAILTGRRQPSTYQLLSEAAGQSGCVVRCVTLSAQGALVPSLIEVEAASTEALAHTAAALGIVWQPVPTAFSMVQNIASLEDHLDRLQWTVAAEMNWKKSFFNPSLAKMSGNRIEADPALIRYEHPHSQRVHFELRRGGRCAKVDGDWGRFAALDAFGQSVLLYDQRQNLLAGLAGAPFPRLVRRTLTMVSGRPPRLGMLSRSSPVFPGRLVEVYGNVMPSFASKVAELLGQRLTLIGNLDQIREQPCSSQ